MTKSIKNKLFLLLIIGISTLVNANTNKVINYTKSPNVESSTPYAAKEVVPKTQYESNLYLSIHSLTLGAIMNTEIIQLDAQNKEIARNASDSFYQPVFASGYKRKITVNFTANPKAKKVVLQLNYGGNPISFTILDWQLNTVQKKPYFKGIYNKADAYPKNKQQILAEMKKLSPATAIVKKHNGVPQLLVNGKPMLLNGYKGHYDFSKFGQAGGDLIISFNCGARLYNSVYWDKALWDEKNNTFNYTRIEDNLTRIYQANPKARVILTIDINPPKSYLEKHPEAIVLNGNKVRGKSNFTSFAGWSNTPLKKGQSWAWSYFSKDLQEYIAKDLRKLAKFLRSTPAGNIIIGFQITGGHDGQFIQWEYGPYNGHFDYSEAARVALCQYLKEIYKTDAALQKAWNNPKVTLETAQNPTPKEFHSIKFANYTPGLSRQIADCRNFIAIGTARMLNFMAKSLKEEWQRPSVVETWYSTTIWAYPTRLALDELIKDEAINIVGMVTNYAPRRSLDGAGGSANSCIQALNLRNVMYIQEMDHRTWRTERQAGYFMNAVAFPNNAKEFTTQILRDASSVLALGGQGFYLYDMFGSWYNDKDALKSIQYIYKMNAHVSNNRGKYPAPKVCIITDESTRLLSEYVPNYVSEIWRNSGVVPALHYLTDLLNPQMPKYDLYILWSPLTITKNQLAKLKSLTDIPGKVLVIIGDAGRSSKDFASSQEVLKELNLKIKFSQSSSGETIIPAPNVKHLALRDVKGVMEQCGMWIGKGTLKRRYAHGINVIDDKDAQILGIYETSKKPAFATKKMPGGGTLFYIGRNAALTSQMLNNFAQVANIKPFAKPGNATFVGNGVAAIHRLNTQPPEIDFGRETILFDPITGKHLEKVKIWRPDLKVGECAAVCYLPWTDNK